MKNHREILENVIARGGLFGMCARHYINDERYATQYIIELSEQCHVENIRQYWGNNLITDILVFSKHHKALKPNSN